MCWFYEQFPTYRINLLIVTRQNEQKDEQWEYTKLSLESAQSYSIRFVWICIWDGERANMKENQNHIIPTMTYKTMTQPPKTEPPEKVS